LSHTSNEVGAVVPGGAAQCAAAEQVGGSACRPAPGERCRSLTAAALTSRPCCGRQNGFWQPQMLWGTIAKDAVGLVRPSD